MYCVLASEVLAIEEGSAVWLPTHMATTGSTIHYF